MNSFIHAQSNYTNLINDPINDEQKQKIRNFVNGYLLTDEDVLDFSKTTSRKITIFEKAGHYDYVGKILSKTYTSCEPNKMKQLQEICDSSCGQRSFEIFRRVLRNPAEKAEEFGLDPRRPDQIFAAQMFMKTVIVANDYTNDPYTQQFWYCNRMSSAKYIQQVPNKQGAEISKKNRLLMQGNPVQKFDRTKLYSAFDVVLANIHFETGERYFSEQERARVTMLREEIKKMAVSLWENPEIHHVIEALGTLLEKEKGNIFITSKKNLQNLSKMHGIETGDSCYTTLKHSVFLNIYDSESDSILIDGYGSFVHECLHLLFNRLLLNRSSPVINGSSESTLLDEALKKDQEYRNTLDVSNLTPEEFSVWETFVDHLEWNLTYVPGKLDWSNPVHVHNMRVESIVRIMAPAAQGIPLESIQKIAPNLFDFYFQYSKPLLEKYINDNKNLFPQLMPDRRKKSPILTHPPKQLTPSYRSNGSPRSFSSLPPALPGRAKPPASLKPSSLQAQTIVKHGSAIALPGLAKSSTPPQSSPSSANKKIKKIKNIIPKKLKSKNSG